ncbi:hypothetical protein CFC21_059541 [Triticum aestivum]|uniref:Uncharacterized protein n=3 Tax=Triticum TaxID=4564 RepID=A0A9R0WGN3_TRITD|nr:uncharacterized protein LOC119294224 isoform X2 [Triticum dicoccoides]XP_044367174.1 uncharacterized protein LOC123089606 isoform X2 [Triticum aestivum]KAF7051289.1 hypothetical protein CFC21_059541 [Triticum aestivum]VAI11030.1 unnamed protein product [Triticum turgidum subsp. durum]
MGDVSTIQRPPGSVAKGNQVGEFVSAGWTNDSHDMYISSMEASFMQQLRGQQLQHHHAHAPASARNVTHVAGHGLKALHVQDGAPNELMSERNVPRSRHVGVRGLPEDPWARRFRPHKHYSGMNRHGDVVGASADDGESGTDTVQKTYRTHGKEVHSCAGENLVGKSSEASGQNFPEDDVHSIAQRIKSCKKRRTAPSTAAGSFTSMLECSDERW